MNNINRNLYIIGVLFAIIWAVGFFIYNVGNTIHVFLVLMITTYLILLKRGNNQIDNIKK